MSCRFRRPGRLVEVPYQVLMCVGQAIELEYKRNRLPTLKWRKTV